MNNIIVPVFRVAHTCHAQHFIIICTISSCEITIGDDIPRGESGTNIIRIGKAPKVFSVFLIHIEIAVFPDPFEIWEMGTFQGLIRIVRIGAIADCVIGININVIYASIIGRHGRNHTVQVFLMFFLRKNLLCDVRNEDHVYAAI